MKKIDEFTYNNLWDVTGYESGIIIYPNSSSLATNWAAFGIEGLPRLFGGTVIGLGEELKVVETKKLSQEEIKQIVSNIQDNLTLISDTDSEVDITSGGKIYKIKANNDIVSVITINDWH